MAKIKANKRPIHVKKDTRWFLGTCSSCRAPKVAVTKVLSSQVCDGCLSGVTSYENPVKEVTGGNDASTVVPIQAVPTQDPAVSS